MFTPTPQPAQAGATSPAGAPGAPGVAAPAGSAASTGVAPKPTSTGTTPFTGGAAKIGGGFLAGVFGLAAYVL